MLARLEIIADVLTDSLSKLEGAHVLHQPHQPSLLPV